MGSGHGGCCEVEKCCCCVDLKLGVKILAVLEIIVALAAGIWTIVITATGQTHLITGGIEVVAWAILLLAAILLLVGAVKGKAGFVLIWFVVAIVHLVVVVILRIVGTVIMCLAIDAIDDQTYRQILADHHGSQLDVPNLRKAAKGVFIVASIVYLVIILAIEIYFIVTVKSFHKKLTKKEITY